MIFGLKIRITIISIFVIFSGILMTKPVLADEIVNQENHPMGYYIKQEQALEESKNANSNSSNITQRSISAPSTLFSNDTSLPRKDAVDVSSYQSWMVQADFNALKSEGVRTIIVKLTEGTTYLNPYAKNQILMAKNAGLNVATYHFVSDPTKIQYEAAFYTQQAKALGLSSNTVMIEDAESPSQYYNWTAVSQVFKDTMNKVGFNNIRYYTSQSWVSSGVMNASILGARNLWVAQYLYGKPSHQDLKNTSYGAWQFTSQMYFQGTANLRKHNLDTSIDYGNIFDTSNGLSEVYRLYNPNSGEHFYTQNFYEKNNLQNVGWRYEGIGWMTASSGQPVYRVYNPNAGDHYYTLSKWEAQQLVNKGWRWDNNGAPAFYSNGSKNLYVAYNPNAVSGSHNYTTSSYEQNHLLKIGWIYGAIAWKVN